MNTLFVKDFFELLRKFFNTHTLKETNLWIFLDVSNKNGLDFSAKTNSMKKNTKIPEIFVSGNFSRLKKNKLYKKFFFLKFLINKGHYFLYFPKIYEILKFTTELKLSPCLFRTISKILRFQTNSNNILRDSVFSCFLDFRDFSLLTPISYFLAFRDSRFLKKRIRKVKKKTKSLLIIQKKPVRVVQ